MASRKALAAAWMEGLPARLKGAPLDEDDAQELERIVREAAMPLPGIALSDEALLRHLAQFAQTPRPDLQSFSAMHLADLCLAWACTERDPRALEMFEERMRPEVRKNTAHLTDVDFDKAWGPFCEVLFAGADGRRPKVLEYSGRGELRKWLHLLFLRSATKAHEHTASTNEWDFVDPKYKDALVLAVRDGLADLSTRERARLVGHVAGGLDFPELARRSSESVAVVQSRVYELRDNLLFSTKRRLMHHASVSKEESEQILRKAWSHLPLLLKAAG